MKVNKSLSEVSDGKLYAYNDMVKADTNGCKGCSACCYGVGTTIVLTPFDMYEIVMSTHQSYEQLLGDKIELHSEEKVILPNLKMQGTEERCGFLDDEERCSIHGHRPGICRLFPLGRLYEGDDFHYIFKVGECVKPNLTKIKVKKWIGINHYAKNRSFIILWHEFLKALKWRVKFIHDQEGLDRVNTYVIEQFYQIPWQEGQDFYDELTQRIVEGKDALGLL